MTRLGQHIHNKPLSPSSACIIQTLDLAIKPKHTKLLPQSSADSHHRHTTITKLNTHTHTSNTYHTYVATQQRYLPVHKSETERLRFVFALTSLWGLVVSFRLEHRSVRWHCSTVSLSSCERKSTSSCCALAWSREQVSRVRVGRSAAAGRLGPRAVKI